MKTMSKRIFSLFLATLCFASIIPTAAFAAEVKDGKKEPYAKEETKPIEDETITPDMITYGNEDGWPILTETGEAYNFKYYGTYHTDEGRFSYYTSKLPYTYHYRTKEWFACDDGIYRTADGYIVVASQHHEKGEIVDTPFGEGMVLDWCGTKGTIDIYTHY